MPDGRLAVITRFDASGVGSDARVDGGGRVRARTSTRSAHAQESVETDGRRVGNAGPSLISAWRVQGGRSCEGGTCLHCVSWLCRTAGDHQRRRCAVPRDGGGRSLGRQRAATCHRLSLCLVLQSRDQLLGTSTSVHCCPSPEIWHTNHFRNPMGRTGSNKPRSADLCATPVQGTSNTFPDGRNPGYHVRVSLR